LDATTPLSPVRYAVPILKVVKLRNAMKEIKFRVHTLHQQMQLVMSCLEMGQHGKALIACREAVRDLENVDSELMRISRMPAEHACASCGCLMASQSKGLSKAIGK
jgi:hypothetical protein